MKNLEFFEINHENHEKSIIQSKKKTKLQSLSILIENHETNENH